MGSKQADSVRGVLLMGLLCLVCLAMGLLIAVIFLKADGKWPIGGQQSQTQAVVADDAPKFLDVDGQPETPADITIIGTNTPGTNVTKVLVAADIKTALAQAKSKLEEAHQLAKSGQPDDFNFKKEGVIIIGKR
jgi:hypothetical protein